MGRCKFNDKGGRAHEEENTDSHRTDSRGHRCIRMKKLIVTVAFVVGLLTSYCVFGASQETYLVATVGGIVYLFWFLRRKWRGVPPKGWVTDDGGKTWHPRR